MHAIERPHLPRVGLLALGVLVAIVVLLLAAPRVGDLGVSATSDSSGTAASATATTINHSLTNGAAFTNAFASPFHVVVPWAKATGR